MDWKGGGYTALHWAAQQGHTPVVTILLDSGSSLETRISARSDAGWTPLSLAARHGHIETAKCLLLRGAQLDTQSDDKNTPLHRASLMSYTDMVQLLLQCGANQEIRNRDGKTAEDLANNDETRSVFTKYKEKKEQSLLLQQAIDEKNFDVEVILRFRGASFEESDKLEKLVDISKNTKILGDNFDLSSRISYRKILNIFNNVPLIRENTRPTVLHCQAPYTRL